MDAVAWCVEPVAELVLHAIAALCERRRASRGLDAERVERAARLLDGSGVLSQNRGGRVRGRLVRDDRPIAIRIDPSRVVVVVACNAGTLLLDPRLDRLPRWLAPLRRLGGVERVRARRRTLTLIGSMALAGDLDHVSRVLARIANARDAPTGRGPYR